MKMQEQNFWDDVNKAQEITQNAKTINDKMEKFNSVSERVEDLEVLIQLSIEEEDESSYREIKKELTIW